MKNKEKKVAHEEEAKMPDHNYFIVDDKVYDLEKWIP